MYDNDQIKEPLLDSQKKDDDDKIINSPEENKKNRFKGIKNYPQGVIVSVSNFIYFRTEDCQAIISYHKKHNSKKEEISLKQKT